MDRTRASITAGWPFLLRGTVLSVHSQEELDAIAGSLNTRRKTLNRHDPLQVLAQVLAKLSDRLPVQITSGVLDFALETVGWTFS